MNPKTDLSTEAQEILGADLVERMQNVENSRRDAVQARTQRAQSKPGRHPADTQHQISLFSKKEE